MQMTRGLTLLVSFALLLCGGCDAGGGGSDAASQGGGSSTGLAPEAMVSALGDDDLVVFCEQGLLLIDVIHELNTDPLILCTGEGLFARFDGDGLVSTCETARDSCLAGAGDGGAPDAALDCALEGITEQGLSSCEVTVDEFDVCHAGFEALLADVQETLKCDMSPEKALEMYAVQQQGYPPECAPVVEQCSLLIDTEGGAAPGPASPSEPEGEH